MTVTGLGVVGELDSEVIVGFIYLNIMTCTTIVIVLIVFLFALRRIRDRRFLLSIIPIIITMLSFNILIKILEGYWPSEELLKGLFGQYSKSYLSSNILNHIVFFISSIITIIIYPIRLEAHREWWRR
jgi:hypothetical protein